jgi:hypothetical protein
MKAKKKHRRLTVIAAALVGCVAVASAEEVVVKYPVANILAGKSAGSDHIVQVKRADKLQVLGHEGSWLKVKFGGKEGYVHENSVASAASSEGSTITSGSSSNVSPASGSLAATGVGESAAWAKSAGKSREGLNELIGFRHLVQESDWKKFMAEGHVGEGQK